MSHNSYLIHCFSNNIYSNSYFKRYSFPAFIKCVSLPHLGSQAPANDLLLNLLTSCLFLFNFPFQFSFSVSFSSLTIFYEKYFKNFYFKRITFLCFSCGPIKGIGGLLYFKQRALLSRSLSCFTTSLIQFLCYTPICHCFYGTFYRLPFYKKIVWKIDFKRGMKFLWFSFHVAL